MDLKSITHDAVNICREVGQFIDRSAKEFSRDDLEYKGTNDLVSYVDKQAEEKLVAALGKLISEAGFLTEEETVARNEKELTWIIDPVDGTTNYVHGIPVYSTTIALYHKTQGLLVGIVHEINRNESFYAWKGGGAYLNGKTIGVSETERINDAVLATGFPYYNPELAAKLPLILHEVINVCQGIRRFGSAAVDLAYVACGRFDGYYEFNLNPWDCAGGALIVQEAGGQVTDFSLGDDYVFGKQIIASNGIIHDSILELVMKGL